MAKTQLDNIEEMLVKLVANQGPEWISEADVVNWLKVSKTTLSNTREKIGLAWTTFNGKTVMYDKKQIDSILFKLSTYSTTGYPNPLAEMPILGIPGSVPKKAPKVRRLTKAERIARAKLQFNMLFHRKWHSVANF
jgi:hypothetical protein